MVIETNRLPSNSTRDLSSRNGRFFYPQILDLVDLSTQAQFPSLRAGQPAGGLVDALSGHVLITQAELIAGGRKALIYEASRVWGVNADTASGVLRASRSGGKALSSSKSKGLVKRFAALREIAEWPWDALHPRRLRDENFGWRSEVRAGGELPAVDEFWQNICSWRLALHAGEARRLAESTSRLLASLRLALLHPSLMCRGVELLDVVDRLLDLMPPQMLPLNHILASIWILTNDEEEALREHIGYGNRLVFRRWRHFRIRSGQFVKHESLSPLAAAGTTYVPWGFLRGERSLTLLAQPRNPRIVSASA